VRAVGALLAALAATSCANCRSNTNEERMPADTPAAIARRVEVTIASNDVGADLYNNRGFIASERCALNADGSRLVCTLPPTSEGGPLRVAISDLSTTPPSVVVGNGAVVDGGAAVVRDGDIVAVAGGAQLPVREAVELGNPGDVDSRWIAVGPAGVMRLAWVRAKARWSLEAYDLSPALRWHSGHMQIPGEPEPATLTASPNGALVAIAVRKAIDKADYDLVVLDVASGEVRWRQALMAAPWRVAFSEDAGQLAVVAKDAKRCETCAKVVIVSSSDGKVVREVPLESRIASEASSVGFAGDQLWLYRYVPAHKGSELAPAGGRDVPPRCAYEAHDLRAAGKPPRTLADAKGEWAKLTSDCQVRALVPRGGVVAAIQVISETTAAVVELDTIP
jgi:hypothetical protein